MGSQPLLIENCLTLDLMNWPLYIHHHDISMTRLPMGAKCGKVTCCGLWVQRSNPGCYSLFEQSSGVGSREALLPPINGWQVRDKLLTAYSLRFLISMRFADNNVQMFKFVLSHLLPISHLWLMSRTLPSAPRA